MTNDSSFRAKALLAAGFILLGSGPALASDIDAQLDKIVSQFASVKQASEAGVALAVFPFQAEEKLTKRKVDVAVGELLTIRLAQAGKFKLVERSQLETVLKEQQLGLSGAVESGTAAKVGRLAGARLVVLGNVNRVGKSYQVTAKLVDTQSSEIVSAQVVEVPARVFDEEAARYLVLVPDEQTIGLYVLVGPGFLGSVSNSSPQTFQGATFTASGSAEVFEFGLGVRYFPVRWLMLDGAYLPSYFKGHESFTCTGGNCLANTSGGGISGSAFQFSANWVKPLAPSWKLFAGAGFGDYSVTQGQGAIVGFQSGASMTSDASFLRPFIRAGTEWKPQARVGLGIFGNYFLNKATLDMYPNAQGGGSGNTISSTIPISIVQLPNFSLEGTLAVYF